MVGGGDMQQKMEQPGEMSRKVEWQLHAAELERDRALDELREMKKLAEEANMRLSEALTTQDVKEVHSQLNSVKDLLCNAKQELKTKEESIESLKIELGKARSLELKLAENVETSGAHTKVLLSESEERIKELQMKLADDVKTSEVHTKALLSEREEKIRELELKLTENVKTSEDLAHMKALLSESEERIRELERKLAETVTTTEAHADAKALYSENKETTQELEHKITEDVEASEDQRKDLLSESEEKIRKLELKLAKDVETNEAQLKALFYASEQRILQLEMEIEKRRKSEARILDSLLIQTNQLEVTKVLLEESNMEIAFLHKKLEKWEDESVQSSDLSTCHQHDSQETNPYSRDELENLKSELQLTKENLVDAQKKEQHVSVKVEKLLEEIRVLKHDLKLTSEAEETGKRAMDDLAFALKEVATEANQLKEKLHMTLAELEHSRAEEERCNVLLKNNEESYKMLLDDVRKENERYKNTAARLKLEHEESVLAWSGKETGFVDCIRRAEEDRYATQQENFRLHELLLETDNRAMLSKEENSKLRDILKQALNEANAAKEAAAIARAENSQLKDNLDEKEEALGFLTRENENYRVNEIAANENIKELKRLLIESSKKDCKKEEKEKPALKDYKKDEKEKPPLKDVKKEAKTPTKESKKEARQKTPTKESKKEQKTPTKEDSSKEKSPVSWEIKEKTTSKEDKEQKEAGTLLGKVFSFSLKELKLSNSHDDVVHAVHSNDVNDEILIDEALKGSIFEVHSPGSATHHRRNSSSFTDDGEPLHPDDFDHLDGTHAENSRKKKALLRRFGDLIKRSTAYTYAKKEPSPDPNPRKEPSQDTKKEPLQDTKKEALPE